MRDGSFYHLHGDQPVDVLRPADFDTRFYAAWNVHDLYAVRSGPDVLTSRRLSRRPSFDA
jgi:hypothetical protein